jgi:hypothetical protein
MNTQLSLLVFVLIFFRLVLPLALIILVGMWFGRRDVGASS